MAPENRDSSEYFLDDSEYDVEDTGSEAADGSSTDSDDGGDTRMACSLSSSAVSQQWPQSFRYILYIRVCVREREREGLFMNADRKCKYVSIFKFLGLIDGSMTCLISSYIEFLAFST